MEIIPFDKRTGHIWYNGEFVPWQDAKIHIMTHGLHYASCVYEGIRAYNGRIFKLKEHIERLHNSAQLLDFVLPYSVAELIKATEATLEKQQLQDAYIRPAAWRGSEKMAVSARDNKIHVAIACSQWPAYYADRVKGITMMIAKWAKPAPNTAPTASKASGIYMISTLSKHDAERAGYQEALMLDYRGYVAEASAANFFLVIKGELHTPLADCFLNGITRRTIIEIAKNQNIKVVERHILPEELAQAEEAFITGTAAEVTPVIQINDIHYKIGPVTQQLIKSYQDLVSS